MKELMQKLLTIRVRPYYIYQMDLAQGIDHFRTPVETGMEIMEKLRGWTSGYGVPTYVIDSPGGGGKVPLAPNYMVSHSKKKIVIKNYKGKEYEYPEVD
jgi:lysine 2,3-aminomutase